MPVLGKAINSTGDGNYKPQTGPYASNNPSPPTLPKDSEGINLKTNGSEYHPPDNQAVESAPTMWRYREWIAFFANLALVIVGILGVGAAYLTLRKIERQTYAAEESTRIAKSNMDALINKERARINLVNPPADVDSLYRGFVRKMTGFPPFAPMNADIDEFRVLIANSGETTARDVRASYSVTITDGKNVLWHEPRGEQIGDMKPDAEPAVISIAVFGGINDEHLSLIHAEKAILKFAGLIYYFDAFSPERRITSFSFRWEINRETIDLGEGRIAYSDSSRWIKSKDPGSNYQT